MLAEYMVSKTRSVGLAWQKMHVHCNQVRFAPYVCGLAWSDVTDMVHGYMMYTERAEAAAVSRGTSHVTNEQRC